MALGRAEEAEQVLGAAQQKARSIGAEPAWWRVTLALADTLAARGRGPEAAAQRSAARTVLEEVASTLPEDLRQRFEASPPMLRARVTC